MPARAVAEARSTAGKVRLLVRPAPAQGPDARVTEAIWRAVRDNHTVHIRYTDVGGLETERDVEPQLIVVGPHGTYLTAWCHLRGQDRVFRLDRITSAERIPSPRHSARASQEPVVAGHETKLPASALGLGET